MEVEGTRGGSCSWFEGEVVWDCVDEIQLCRESERDILVDSTAGSKFGGGGGRKGV